MALKFHLQLLQFQPRASALGREDLSALHALLYILQVCTYQFREGYIGHKIPQLTL